MAVMRERNPALRLRQIRYRIAGLAVTSKFLKLALSLKQYDPDQPRVPAGNDGGGRWTSGNIDAEAGRRDSQRRRLVQSYSMGDLVVEIPAKIGRDCIYRFDFGLVKVPGPTNLRCPQRVPSAAVNHGQLLNDN